MRISYRTQVLIILRDLETKFGRGVKFGELIAACDFDQDIISKSLDSLDDAGLIHQADAEMEDIEGEWEKLLSTRKECRSFIDNVIRQINELEGQSFETRQVEFPIPNNFCKYYSEPSGCTYDKNNLHTCCKEECELVKVFLTNPEHWERHVKVKPGYTDKE